MPFAPKLGAHILLVLNDEENVKISLPKSNPDSRFRESRQALQDKLRQYSYRFTGEVEGALSGAGRE